MPSSSPSPSSASSQSLSRSQSQSPPSPEKRSLYMFFKHKIGGSVSHSLYKVGIPSDTLAPIPSKESLLSQVHNPNPLNPTLLFYSHEFPYGMRCVELGSKLYFLGGEKNGKIISDDFNWVLGDKDILFPPKLHILDPATLTNTITGNASDFLTLVIPMKTGKEEPIVFVAFGKIYALSAPCSRLESFGLEHFEVFDPTIQTWTPLPPPPFYNFVLRSHALVKTKIYILAGPLFSKYYRIYCFDLNNNEWIPSSKLRCPSLHRNYHVADFVEDTLYGFSEPNVIAFGPIQDTDEDGDGDGEFFERMVHFSSEAPLNFSLHPFMVLYTHFLTHLGNRRFCYVVSGNPPQKPVPKIHEDITYDPQILYISIAIFDALSLSDPKAKFLHSAHYVSPTPWGSGLPKLCNSFLTPIAANDAGFGGEAEL